MAALHDVGEFFDARERLSPAAIFGLRSIVTHHGVAQMALRDLRGSAAPSLRRRAPSGFSSGVSFEQRLEFVGEAHVEHFVGFVEYDGARA